jgi:phosphoglycerol geranylgeranyltransferase
MSGVFEYLIEVRKKRRGYLVLLDPEKEGNIEIAGMASSVGTDALLIGGSTLENSNFEDFVVRVRKKTDLPLILFPGSKAQLTNKADALFLLSLVSGRNPEFLIGEHVRSSLEIKRLGIETIPVGYILVESGNPTTVVEKSNTQPIGRDDLKSAKAHALAAQFLGLQMIYLEAGSGAEMSVPIEMIREVKKEIRIPLIVGGGIRTPREAIQIIEAGADFFVTGNIIEENPSMMKDFASAVQEFELVDG